MFVLVLGALAPLMVFRNLRIMRDPRALRRYVETSWRYRRLRESMGVEATMDMAKRRLLPVGTVMWGIMALLGLAAALTRTKF
jgi:hypothetical protein